MATPACIRPRRQLVAFGVAMEEAQLWRREFQTIGAPSPEPSLSRCGGDVGVVSAPWIAGAPTLDQLDPTDFAVWDAYMVKETAKEWHQNLKRALAGEDDAQGNAYSLVFYDATEPDAPYQFTDAPGVLNKAFTPPTTGVDAYSGGDRLVLRFQVSADLNIVKTGTTKPNYLVSLERDITFALVPNRDHHGPGHQMADSVMARHVQVR